MINIDVATSTCTSAGMSPTVPSCNVTLPLRPEVKICALAACCASQIARTPA